MKTRELLCLGIISRPARKSWRPSCHISLAKFKNSPCEKCLRLILQVLLACLLGGVCRAELNWKLPPDIGLTFVNKIMLYKPILLIN